LNSTNALHSNFQNKSGPSMKITFSQHADDQLQERDLTRDMVVEVLSAPLLTTPDPTHTDRTRAYGAIKERDGRIMRVVYVVSDGELRVISAFLDRTAPRYIESLTKNE
jgi:hypothetical protein